MTPEACWWRVAAASAKVMSSSGDCPGTDGLIQWALGSVGWRQAQGQAGLLCSTCDRATAASPCLRLSAAGHTVGLPAGRPPRTQAASIPKIHSKGCAGREATQTGSVCEGLLMGGCSEPLILVGVTCRPQTVARQVPETQAHREPLARAEGGFGRACCALASEAAFPSSG